MAELLAGVRRLPAFDEAAAAEYAKVLAVREGAGLPITMGDAQIGVELVDPWAVS